MDLVEVGEMVKYTGDTSYAPDVCTLKLMNEMLVVGEWYEVEGIKNEGLYKDHYFFVGRGRWLFPYKSFVRTNKEFCEKRYNLI